MALILDIECVAAPDALDAYDPTDRTPPANYKSDEAIAKWREADKLAYLKDCTFSPRTSRIVAVGLYDDTAAPDYRARVLTTQDAEQGRDEHWMLAQALDAIADHGRLVTFNGLAFDLPFLFSRAAILGVVIPFAPSRYLKRYNAVPHTDLFAILANYGPARKGDSLHGWARAFGLDVNDGWSGADIAALFAANDWDGIRAHCLSDITLTAGLYDRLVATGRLD